MRLGADATDACRDARHLLDRPVAAEHLETAQLRDLEVGVREAAVVVEEEVDLAVAFEAGDRIDGDGPHGRTCLLRSVEAGRLNR